MSPTTSAEDSSRPLSQGRRSRSPQEPRRPASVVWRLLAHPITIVRAALDPTSKLSNLRKQGNLQLVDVTVRQGDTLTLAVNATSNLPAWVSYVGPNANLGDVTYRTAFAGYVPEKGIQLPTGFATTIDFPQRRAEQTLRRSQHRRCTD